jgi:hypothetical protein
MFLLGLTSIVDFGNTLSIRDETDEIFAREENN